MPNVLLARIEKIERAVGERRLLEKLKKAEAVTNLISVLFAYEDPVEGCELMPVTGGLLSISSVYLDSYQVSLCESYLHNFTYKK